MNADEKTLAADDLISPEAQHRLMVLADSKDSTAWAMARLVQEIANKYRNIEGEWLVSATRLFSAIATYSNCAASTCRSYWDVAHRLPVEIQSRYDMLGFHMHKAILGVSKGEPTLHAELCDEWLATADDFGGRVGSLDALRRWLKEADGAEIWRGRLERAVRAVRSLCNTGGVPQKLRNASETFLEAAANGE